ncbi:MAG: hypothetical protein ACTH1D_09495 [Mycobacteriaceae bacterium]
MAHYDIYRSLGLDRNASGADLARELDSRLSATPPGDAAAVEELTTARSILGDGGRRSLYDQRLDDPNAPEIDVDSLRELAALDLGGPGSAAPGGGVPSSDAAPGKGQEFGRQAGQFARQAGSTSAAAGKQVKDSFTQSKGLAIGLTALVTAVVVLLGGWGMGKLLGGDGQPDFSDAQGTVDDMLEQDDVDELRDWLQDNSLHEMRDDVISSLNASEGGSFNGMDAVFDGSGLEAGVGMSLEQMAMTANTPVDSILEDAQDDGVSREEAESVVVVGVRDGDGDYKGNVTLAERDGDYSIVQVSPY